MSRPQKLHKPIKGNFTDIINAIADGRGVKSKPTTGILANRKQPIRASEPPPKKP